MARRIPTVG